MTKKQKHKQRAVLYGRFSEGPNQREESITGQFREGELLCEKNNWPIVARYADKHLTGRSDNRPQFQQMIKDAEKGLFDVVVCYKTDRFARDRFDAAIYKNKLRKCGVRVVYSKMNIPEGPEGVILESVLEGLDEYYSKDLSQKIMRGFYDNALQCKATGGPIPFGYKLDEQKKYIIDEDKAPIVREIFLRYAQGEAAINIINDLNSRGIRTARDKEFNKGSLHRMFRNIKYKGILHFESSDENFEDVHFENGVPAIIDAELFDKAAERLKTNKRKTQKIDFPPPVFYLSGKMFDASCGGAFIGDSGTSKTKTKHFYYTCQNKKHHKGCKTKSIRKDFIEDLVLDYTKQFVLTDEFIDYIAEIIEKVQEEEKDLSMLKSIQSDLNATKNSLQNILKAIEQGIFTDTTKSRLLELEKRQQQLEAQLQFENAKVNAPKIKKDFIEYRFRKLAESDITDPETKNMIINLFINSVILKHNSAIISYNYAPTENYADTAEIDFQALKNSIEKSVRLSSLNWSLRCNSRTLKGPFNVCIDTRNQVFYLFIRKVA